MALRRKKKDQEPAADQGDAFEPLAGKIVNTDFPPEEPTGPQAAATSGSESSRASQRQLGEEPQQRRSLAPRPVITEVISDAQTGAETTARYIDGYNSGVGVNFQFPTDDERPSEDVKQPLKEERQYGQKKQKGMRWRADLEPKQWHKGVRDNAIGTRLETEGRFADSVKKVREEKEGQEPDGGIQP
jgi:hypothetical protein